MDKDAMNGKARGAGFLVNLYQFVGVECAVLKLFPQEPEGVMIAKWAASATDSNVVCDFRRFSDEIIVSLLTFYTADRTEKINGHACYGIGYGQARAMLGGITWAHREMGCPFTPTKSPIIQTVLKRIEHKDDPKGGPSFDPAVDLLPMIYGLIRQEGRMLLKRVQDCAMLVLHFYLMARTSDMTNFSFAVEDMKWPMKDSRYFCLDGQPLHPLSFTGQKD
ncbi:hypothetical protein M885DRAFT_558885 [Pelagophyceae sp. CCMP2097]|nr:hypothetical protein M885DRAFT_558885 [Pelagophyceae sp. CCMP2097]